MFSRTDVSTREHEAAPWEPRQEPTGAAGSQWVEAKGFASSFLSFQSLFYSDSERRFGLRAPGEVNKAHRDLEGCLGML